MNHKRKEVDKSNRTIGLIEFSGQLGGMAVTEINLRYGFQCRTDCNQVLFAQDQPSWRGCIPCRRTCNFETEILEAFDQSLFLSSLLTISHGDIGEAPFLLKTSSQVIVTSVDGAGTTLTLHEVMLVFRFDFVTADIASYGIFNNHCEPSFAKSSCIKCTP